MGKLSHTEPNGPKSHEDIGISGPACGLLSKQTRTDAGQSEQQASGCGPAGRLPQGISGTQGQAADNPCQRPPLRRKGGLSLHVSFSLSGCTRGQWQSMPPRELASGSTFITGSRDLYKYTQPDAKENVLTEKCWLHTGALPYLSPEAVPFPQSLRFPGIK